MAADPIMPGGQTAPRPAWRRWLVRLAVMPVGLGLATSAVALWLNTEDGRAYVARTLSTALDGPGLNVDVTGLEGNILGTFRLTGVTVADTDGIWLTAERLTASWHPFALAHGLVSVESLVGDGIKLKRLPKASEGGGDGGLPVAIRLDQADLALSYGATGESYRLNGAGIVLDSDHMAGSVQVAGGPDRADARLDWRPAERTLDAALDFRAGEGGLLSALTGLGAKGPINAALNGSGPLETWQGSFTLDAGAVLKAKGNIKGHDGGIGFRAVIDQHLDLPPAAAALLWPDIMMETWLDLSDAPKRPFKVWISGPNRLVALKGELDADGQLASGMLTLKTDLYQADAALGDLTLTGLSLEGEVGRDGGALRLDYQLKADAASGYGVAGRALALDGGLVLDAYHIGGTVQELSLDQVTVADQVPAITLQSATGSWDVRRADNAWRLDFSKIETDRGAVSSLQLAGAAGGGLNELTLEGNLKLSLLDQIVPGLVTAGRSTVRLSAEGQDDGGLAVDYALAGAGVAWADQAVADMIGDAPTLNGHLVWQPVARRLDALSVRLVGAYLSGAADGALDYGAGQLEAAFSLDLNEEAPLLASAPVALPTGLQLTGQVAGALAQPDIRLRTRLDSLEAYGLTLTDIRTSLTLKSADKAWQGQLLMTGLSDAGPVALTGPLVLAGPDATLGPIALTSPLVNANGQVAWRGEQGLDADMTATMVRPEEAGFALDGTATGKFTLTGRPDAMEGKLALDAEAVALTLPGKFPFELKALTGSLSFSLKAGTLDYDTDLSLEALRYGAREVSSLTIKRLQGADSGFQLAAAGYLGQPFALKANVHPSAAAARIDSELIFGGLEFKTREPVQLGWTEGLRLDAPALALDDGTASLSLQMAGPDIKGQASLRNIPLVAVNRFRAGLFRSGRIGADLQFDRLGETDGAQGSLMLSDVRVSTKSLLAGDDSYTMQVSGSLKDGLATLDAQAALAGTKVGTVKGRLPVVRSDDGLFAIRAGAPIDMALNWQGDVAPLWLLARQPDHLLEGRLIGSLSLTGDLDNPVFAGDLALEGGRYEYERLGLVAEDMTIAVSGNNEAVVLQRLAATDGDRGRVRGHGRFELSEKLSFPGSLAVKFRNFRMARLDTLTGTASATLDYVRAAEADKVTGTITTGTINFTLPKELPQSVVDIEVVEIGGRKDEEAAAQLPMVQIAPKRKKLTNLDVGITVPSQLFVRGRGLESEWTGKLAVGGSTATPQIGGTMSLKTGTFLLGGKRFTINAGSLTFRGGRQIDPDINLTATYATTGLTAELKIFGPVSAPKFSLSSTPALAEDEILARVLFGRSVADLTPLQIAELAVALNSLRGSTAFDVVGKLRRQLGLDSLTIASGDEDVGGALLTGGKYLRDNIYLEVETSTATSEASARLKVNLTRNLLAESEVGPRRGSSLKLKWFWEY